MEKHKPKHHLSTFKPRVTKKRIKNERKKKGLRIKQVSSFNWMINVIITVVKYNIYSKPASKNQKKIPPRYHIAAGMCRKKKSIDYDVI